MSVVQQKQTFLSPVLRLVQGHPMEKQEKNMQGQPLMTKQGVPTQRYFMAGAIAKNDPAWPAFFQLLSNVARQSFPQLFNAQGQCVNPKFSWKVIDGDGVDDNGKPNNQKPGFAGCWVVKFQSSFPPRCFYVGQYQPSQQIQDARVIQRGYYVRVSGSIEGNADTMKPGLYVNLDMVELAAQGEVIVTGPDAGSVFGGTPSAALPQGATAFGATPGAAAAPTFPSAGPAMSAPVAPMAPVAPQMMPGAQPAVPGLPMGFPGAPAPALPVQPNAAFAAGPGVPPAPPAPAMPAPPPAGPQLTPAGVATGYTLAQFQSAGWAEAQLRQAGYIV